MSTVRGDVAKIIKALQRQGAEVRKCGNSHYKVVNPLTRQGTVISSSPSDHRWRQNVRKTLRAIGYQPDTAQ